MIHSNVSLEISPIYSPPLIFTGKVKAVRNLVFNGSDFERERDIGNPKQAC